MNASRPSLPVRPARPAVPSSKAGGTEVSAELLALALRAQSEGVFIAAVEPDGSLRILFVNDSLCTMTGRPAAELTGRSHRELHPDAGEGDKIARWLETATAGRPLIGEGYLLRPDGHALYAAWNYDAMPAPSGRIVHVVATYRDTTERRKLHEALIHAQRLDAVGRLAGGVAHDFNNLISVINGYCQILASEIGQDNPQLVHQVQEIHKAGQKAASLTRQLLAFGRRQPMNPRVISLNQVVRDNVEILQRVLGDAGTLALELDPQLPNVRTDPLQFQQVLLNLVLNARDALRPPGKVTISTRPRQIPPGMNRRVTDVPPGRYVALTIADNGMGMDEETLSHLFEPFFTTKEEGKGSGLGLPLVYGVVQQSGGYVSVQSTVDVGSSFEVLLPETEESAETMSNSPLPTLPETRGTESVLLVEADPVLCKMVGGILTSDGYRVTTATDARAALVELRTGSRFELLIATMHGRDRANERLVHRLELGQPDLRVINIGSAEPGSIPWLGGLQHMHLPKPFALSELLKAVRHLLDLKRN